MADPSKYSATPPVNEIVTLAEALQLLLAEGLEARFARQERIARALRAGLAALGLDFVTDAGCRADTLSVVRIPEGIVDLDFRKEVASRGVVLAGGLGPLAGKAFRLGHMGNFGPGEAGRALMQSRGTSGLWE